LRSSFLPFALPDIDEAEINEILPGLEPGRDVKIIYTGIRPGEKLGEELLQEGEDYRRTRHEKIFIVTHENKVNSGLLEQVLGRLMNLPRPMQLKDAMELMHAVIPEYHSTSPTSLPSPSATVSSPRQLDARSFLLKA
jgi:FlaA1/EpsC-like NDP-sugar epimerase